MESDMRFNWVQAELTALDPTDARELAVAAQDEALCCAATPSTSDEPAPLPPCRARSRPPSCDGGLLVERVVLGGGTQKSMPPMPPEGSPPMGAAFSGLSATTTSVVRNSAAIDAAF